MVTMEGPSIKLLAFWITGTILCFHLSWKQVDGLQTEYCQAQTQEVVVNPTANAFISVLLGVRKAGEDGLFACGQPERVGVEVFEAMRWAVNLLNGKDPSGKVQDESGNSSFIPGISFGLRVFDTCGHSSSTELLLAEAFPVLRDGPAPCAIPSSSSSSTPGGQPLQTTPLAVGLADGTAAVTEQPRVYRMLQRFHIPALELNPVTLIPAEDRAKALSMLTQQLGWRRVAVLYSSKDDYSARMFRTIVRLSTDASMCLLVAADISGEEGEKPGDSIRRSLTAIFTASNAKRQNGPSGLGVLVLLNPTDLDPVLKMMHELTTEEDSRQLKWLFSRPLTGDHLRYMGERESFAITLSPASIPDFENYWQNRKGDIKRASDTNWLMEYEMRRRRCRFPGWAGPGISDLPRCLDTKAEDDEGPEETLARASNAVAGIHAVHTFAHALRSAWESSCGHAPGPCSTLIDMQRREFVESYLNPLEFEHGGEGNVIPGAPVGGKLKTGNPSHLAAARMGLVAYRLGLNGEILPKEVYAYHLEAIEVLDSEFQPEAISCSESGQGGGCEGCLRVREGRVEGGLGGDLHRGDKDSAPTPLLLIPSPQNLYIAGIFSLRNPGAGQLSCGDEVNMESVRQVEAFMWALRRFNDKVQSSSPGSPRLGAILLDTCSSRVRSLTLPAGLLSDGSGRTPPHVVAAVNALLLPDAEAAAGVLSALNVSSVATGEASSGEEIRSHFSLQVEAPLSMVSASIIRILQYLGWSYISIVYSEGDAASEAGLRAFREAADNAGICISLEVGVSQDNSTTNSLAANLVGARAAGARGVALWTNTKDTHSLMKAMSTAHAQGTLRREDVFWLVASPTGEAREIFEEYGNAVGGALIFSPLHRPVREFLQHLRRVRPNGPWENENPWLQNYVKKALQCKEPECRRVLESGRPSDANTVQAVFSIGSAIVRARKELCPGSKASLDGLCHASAKVNRAAVNRAVNAYLRYAASEKADGTSGEEFRLTADGAGDVPVEILNFRRGPRGRSRSLGNVYYESVGLFQHQLKTLTNMVTYRDSGDEVQVSTLASQCAKHCQRCRHRSMDRMTTTTLQKDNEFENSRAVETFYLAAALGVHEPSPRPLECSSEVSTDGMLQLEALLWAVEQANRNGSLLPPSVRLAALALDTCNSAQKTARDVANLVGEAEAGDKGSQTTTKPIAATRMVAFIAGGGTEVTKPAVDILAPLGIAVLAPEATGSVLRRRKKHAPYPLQLSPGNSAQSSALVALLSKLQWTSFSVIYLEDGIEYEDIFQMVEKEARGRGLRLATAYGLPVTETGDELGLQSMKEALRQVERRREEGVKAVLLLLPPKEVDLLLRTARTMRSNGQMAPGGIIWVGVGSEDVYETHRDQAQGALILRPKVGWVEEFEKHFKDLNISSNIQNPWFPDFWASVFHCRGAACRSGLYRNLHSYYVKQNPYVVNTINAVLAVAHALESVHRELCPDHISGLCKAMKDVGRVKRRLFEVAPHMAFVGAGLNGVAFTQGGENSHAGLEVLNVRQVGSAVWGLVSVGSVSTLLSPAQSSEREEGDELVKLDINKAKAYEIEKSKSKEIPITEVISQCITCDRQKDSLWEEPTFPESKQNFMEVVSNRRFSILSFIPLHEEGANYLHCGSFKSITMYKTAAAFAFALDRINKNTSILPGIKLGALLWDYCSQPARAHDRLFTFFSRNSEAVASPESALAALVIGKNTAESLAPILQAQGIPQLTNNIDGEDEDDEPFKHHSNTMNNALKLSVDEFGEIEALISIVNILKWDYVVILHSTSMHGDKMMNHFKMRAIENEICIGSTLPISVDNTDKDLTTAVYTLKQLSSATVVILLLDSQEETHSFFDAVGKHGGLRERFTFLSGNGWGGKQNIPHNLEQISAGSIIVGQEEWDIPGFEEYFDSLLKTNFTSKNPYNAPLPLSWNKEAKEMLASCSNDNQNGCIKEKLSKSKDSHLYLSTVKAVTVIATTLHRFLDKNCSHRFDASSIASCGPETREKLNKEIKMALEEEGLGRLFIWNVYGREMKKIGWWNPKQGLSLDVDRLKFRHSSQIPTAECTSGPCIRVCAEQMPRYAAKATPIRPLPLDGAGTLEGVILSALTVFGLLVTFVILVIQCIPSHGRRTTSPSFPLNFLILFGVVMLLCSNFAFILSATETICSTRRSLPGIAYSTILAGLLVEVVDRWRRYSENKPLKEVSSCHPVGLLMSSLALILVQAFLATGWLLLVASMIEPFEDFENSKSPLKSISSVEDKDLNEPQWMATLWRCSPASNFEAHFLLSMSYNLLLLIATSLLVLCIRRQGRRQEVFMGVGKKKERRSQIGVEGGIIACCSIMWIIWVVGIIASLILPYKRREVVIIVADLFSGVIVLCTLFMRDAYATSRKKIKHKEEAMTVAAIPGINSRFPYPQPIFSISHFKAQHGFVTETGTGDEDPTQVVPSLLYPLDMFSQTSHSMEDCEEDELQGLGVDDDENEGQINETFEDSDPDDDKDSWSQNIVAHLTIPDHREPGTNEFTAPEDEDIPRSLMATAKGHTLPDRLDPFSL